MNLKDRINNIKQDLYYHISNKYFDNIKSFNNNGISLLLACPTKKDINKLAMNNFKPWQEINNSPNGYYIYEVNLNKESDNILEYRLTSLPEEIDYSLRKYATREGKRKYLNNIGIENTFTSYNNFKKEIRPYWRDISLHVNNQIKYSKTLKHDYINPYEMYALFIPHVIITMKPGKDLKPINIYHIS